MKEITRVRLETRFKEADGLFDTNVYEDAYDKLKSIVEEEPSFGKAYNHLGWLCQWKFKDYVAAEDYYKKAIESSPEYFAGYSNYAILLNQMQRWDDLMALVDKGLVVPSATRGTLYNELGMMYEKRAMFEQAIEAYKKYAIDSTDNETYEKAKKSMDRCRDKVKMLR